jgi:hypothetical protein
MAVQWLKMVDKPCYELELVRLRLAAAKYVLNVRFVLELVRLRRAAAKYVLNVRLCWN